MKESLCFAMESELNEYYRLIAILEQELSPPKEKQTLTLDGLLLWMQEPMERMKWLAILSDQAQSNQSI